MTLDRVAVTLIGHPWAPIGMGEQLRSHIQACAALQIDARVLDIFRYAQRGDPAHARLIGSAEIDRPAAGIRIFHVNGDEVDDVIAAFAARGGDFAAGYNIIVPAWELPVYPRVWAERLGRFDEVWALSRFIGAALAAAGVASQWVGQSVELPGGPLLPRRHFGIRESAFVLLNFFDLSSYASRKNPEAALALLERIRAEDRFADVQLVLKVKNGEGAAAEWAARLREDAQLRLISAPLDGLGVRSLIAACDCFVSLHRAEGFGRGLGEAMALGRLALGTGWSGNLDFMTAENSLLAPHRMVRLKRDDYPHGRGQSWAEADVAGAHALLRPILADPARGQAMAQRGQASVLRSHGNRAVGLRILERLERIAEAAVPPIRAERRA
jgi:hypothetical protein